jgi:hypothetical protein
MLSTPEKSDISKMPHKINSAKYMHIKKGKPETYIHSLEIVQSSFCFFYKSTSPNRLWKISPPDNTGKHESNQNNFEKNNYKTDECTEQIMNGYHPGIECTRAT